MLFAIPEAGDRELEVLGAIDDLRQRLRHQFWEPGRWFGPLRRLSLARAVQGSNTIEGYTAALDDAAAIVLREEPLDSDLETRQALEGYRDAMTYVLQLADETDFAYSTRLFKSLHFMMTSHRMADRPGLWRQSTVYVRRADAGEIVYEGADADLVPGLMENLAESLNTADTSSPLVTAAMAHLNLVLIHPFKDGNGRMARCLQSLVLAREGVPLSPVFLSIEEYLGHNTQAFYDVLAEVGGGRWQPNRDALPWVRFNLTAHLHQARTLDRRVQESEKLWTRLEAIAETHRLSGRCVVALFDAATGLRVRNATYRAVFEDMGEEVTEATATRDLRAMVDSGLLLPRGEKRGRYYVAAGPLTEARDSVTRQRDPAMFADPFSS